MWQGEGSGLIWGAESEIDGGPGQIGERGVSRGRQSPPCCPGEESGTRKARVSRRNDVRRGSVQEERGSAARPLLPIVNLRSGLAVPEESNEALVDAYDGLEEFMNPHGFASYFVSGQAGGNGLAELSGAADTFSSQQGEHSEGILLPRLALLPLFNGQIGRAS